jgi:hypothetical protein
MLFYPLLGICMVGWALIYLLVTPTYTAEAIIGPPNPSPTNSMIAQMGISGLGSSITSKLAGIGGGSENNPYQEYLQLLHSRRLVNDLVAKDDILPKVFYKHWDARDNRWKPPSILHEAASVVKRLLNRPVSDHPDENRLSKYFEKHLTITQISNGAISLANLGSGYMSVKFDLQNRQASEAILNTILSRADDEVRSEQLRDVVARIDYINKELPNVHQSEQIEALIEVLSHQQHLQIMMVADKRFAFTLISPPFASTIPTKPPSFIAAILISLLISILVFCLLLWFEPRSDRIKKIIAYFYRPNPSQSLPQDMTS